MPSTHAQHRIDNGANSRHLAHIVNGDYVSTPISPEEHAQSGYTARYFTLAFIASGALDVPLTPPCTTSALEDQCYEDATIEAAELVGPNSYEYDSLVESISERLFNERSAS